MGIPKATQAEKLSFRPTGSSTGVDFLLVRHGNELWFGRVEKAFPAGTYFTGANRPRTTYGFDAVSVNGD